jgi:Fe-coproporphyrin III synthase
MHVSTRCDQACAHCSIWTGHSRGGRELGAPERLAIIREAHSLGARSILFTGGEPLLCDHLETLSRAASGLGLSVQIATNGLGLSRAASWIGGVVDEVYVSLEGPETVHDGVRGAGMFSRLRSALSDVRALPRRPRLIGRSTISSRNIVFLDATVRAARSLGLDALSFLPIDASSDAFGGDPSGRLVLRPNVSEVAELQRAIAGLAAIGELGSFVIEDSRKLLGFAKAFLADDPHRVAPACDAPEWSSVVEADGAVRPCFFQPPVPAPPGLSLREIRASRQYAEALKGLGPGNSVCAACVCPKSVAAPLTGFRRRVGAALQRAVPQIFQRAGSAA